MSPRTTGVMAVLALVLAAFVFFYEIEGETSRQAARDRELRLHPGLEASEVEAIALETSDGVDARFERREGRWMLIQPIEAAADASALDAIASALVDLPRAGTVSDAEGLEQFGLGEDARVARFEAGGETRGVRIGRSTPVGGNVYVARLADDEVAYVEKYRLNALDRELRDLRDKRLFAFATSDVRTLRVRWGEEEETVEVALARDAEGDWQLGVPLVDRADAPRVRDLLADLSQLRAQDFIDERTVIHEALLDAPLVSLFWTLEGDHVERRARIGARLGEGHLIEGPEGRLYTIAAERLEDIPRRVVDYRFKQLSAFAITEARRLELEFAGREAGADEGGTGAPRRVVAELEDAGWQGGDPPIDPERASDLVRALSGLVAVDIVADEMGPAELESLGLAPPAATLRAATSGEGDAPAEVIAEVWLGRLDPDRGLFARQPDRSTVYLLEASAAADLPISGEAYVANFAAPAPAPESEAPEGGAAGEPDTEAAATPEADPLEGVELP